MIVKSLKTSQLWGLFSSTSIYSMYRFNSKIHVIWVWLISNELNRMLSKIVPKDCCFPSFYCKFVLHRHNANASRLLAIRWLSRDAVIQWRCRKVKTLIMWTMLYDRVYRSLLRIRSLHLYHEMHHPSNFWENIKQEMT